MVMNAPDSAWYDFYLRLWESLAYADAQTRWLAPHLIADSIVEPDSLGRLFSQLPGELQNRDGDLLEQYFSIFSVLQRMSASENQVDTFPSELLPRLRGRAQDALLETAAGRLP